MSGSAALEYGFPSTHSTNAVSVAVYALFTLHSPDSTTPPTLKLALEILSYCYATSIIIGRLYCGMHGFFDVVIGSVLGALLSIIECLYGDIFDEFIYTGSLKSISIVLLSILVLVRIHPEPADNCPCFDDSVAFAGVLCGVELGNWHFAKSALSWNDPVPATVPFSLETLGWSKTMARIVIGVLCIFAWRGIMKPTLLRGLPPIFRVIERLGLTLPRRFFMQASEYHKVPKHLKVDNVMPSVSDIPSMLSSIRNLERSRSISIGPQSAADAYETMAFREKRRRESISQTPLNYSSEQVNVARNESLGYFDVSKPRKQSNAMLTVGSLPTPALSSTSLYDNLMENDISVATPITPDSMTQEPIGITRSASQDRRQNEKEDREMFSQLEKPRVRYDVEVITKLIVYTGIAWLAVEGNPIFFQILGLGIDPTHA
ncbi:hypothetical protein MMC14_007709 [Varicellaria rhodocarpa]|nr:hypothetical protein [Varicellaria rhodocarpa]